MKPSYSRIPGAVILIVFLACFVSCQRKTENIPSPSQVNDLTGRILKIWNQGDLSELDSLYSADYVRHHPTPSAEASLDDLKKTVIANRATFPDYRVSFDEIFTQGDRIFVFATMTGTNTAPVENLPPTGKEVKMEGVYIYRIDQGKIAEEWTYFNLLSYYQQLGFVIGPPQFKGEEKLN